MRFEEVPDYYVALVKQAREAGASAEVEGSGQLQRVYRHGRVHQRSSDRDRA